MQQIGFGADGIRYLAGLPPLDREGVARIGHAIARYLLVRSTQPLIIVGRDTRASGVWISEVLQAAWLAEGVNAVDVGVMTTPGVAFLTRDQEADLGVAISASHNPGEYNGVKLVGRSGLRLQREDEIEIERVANAPSPDHLRPTKPSADCCSGDHLRDLYVHHHIRHAPGSLAGFGVVLDCAHGAACSVAPEVFRSLGARVEVINAVPDGANINLAAGSEHVRRSPNALVTAVKANNTAYGYAFDGDGDRLVVVDAAGHVFDGDDLLFALACHYQGARQLRHQTVVTSQLANRGLDLALGSRGISLVRAGKGDKAVEAAMWSGGYVLGGEQVGNIIINDGYHTAADGVFTAVVLSCYLQATETSLRDAVAPFQKWPQVRASLYAADTLPGDAVWILEEIAQRRAAALGTDDCRVSAWRSTTEDGVLRLLLEAPPMQGVLEVRQMMDDICRAFVSTASAVEWSVTIEPGSKRLAQ